MSKEMGRTGALLACVADDRTRTTLQAAPELLAAIRETVRRFDENDATDALEAVDTLLRAAIAKAEGGAA